ncbi:pantoate--beta-alanine ligase [Marixanthomonas spongiae]|uniref:Pantothenate synthetase n=1 Tax=Marixanthomonas spongiae TaxID=2174845 RepID=A0A2U0HZG5_9FLAO|nr:pantoate--beta-alanine ligase [Marixanthomonas spongiae]PVW14237.1 pantoate--beta-alanine ligase [Marixanthomonas spongiae]
MSVHTNRESLLAALTPWRKSQKIGFVPTMGALHQGHVSLVNRALQENDCVVVSIFVNPTQFNNTEDLERYPRTLESDIALLNSLHNNIFVYAPEASELYGNTVEATNYNFQGLEHEMEGKHRKGHFNGVGTILNLLFTIIEPDRAYFGEKDFQQLQIVKKLVEIENLPVAIVGVPIVREESGLALSSRNQRLSAAQKEEAVLISETLRRVKERFSSHSISELNRFVKETFDKNDTLVLEYFEIANEKTLKTAVKKQKNEKYRAFIAVFAGEIRLIDNMALN